MAFNLEHLRVEGYNVTHIEACKIEAACGEHTTLCLKAILDESMKDEVIHTTNCAYPIKVYAKEETGETVLFCGVVTWVQVRLEADVYWLEVEAKSYTYLMDIKKCSRSFQNLNTTVYQVVKYIMNLYPHSDFILNIPDHPIGELIIQYEETDWEFIKRIASTDYAPLLPAIEIPGIRFFIGIPEIPVESLVIKKMELSKDLNAYYYMKAGPMKNAFEVAYAFYKIRADEIARLGQFMSLNGQNFYIRRLICELKGSAIVNTYEIQLKMGLYVEPIYPMTLIGVALEGKIMVPQADKVKVHLNIDKTQAENDAYWFPYSTMSASTDGSGWYCMPEIGDTVRVYFPTKYTKDAIALSAVSIYDKPQGGPDRMSNPDVKYLGTIHDKEIKLAPDQIRIACNGSQSVVSITKEGKISMYAAKNIEVTAEEMLLVKATKDLEMTATENITLRCDKGGRIILDEAGNIIMKGTEVKVD